MTAVRLIGNARADRVRTMTLSQATDLYLAARAGSLRPRTIVRYRTFLDKLADMYPHHDVDEITVDMIRRYVWIISHRVDNAAELLDVDTINQRIGIVKQFFEWLDDEDKIPFDPCERVQPPKRKDPIENDNIISVTSEEARRMLEVAGRDVGLKRTPQDRWRSSLCLGVLAYTGGRRHAVAQLRIGDYDGYAEPPTLTFREKGGKTIRKPVSKRLAGIIREADLDGVWQQPSDYLIPSKASPRKAERDDRIIYDVVKEVAADAKVVSHVHALRAAFAVLFLDKYPGQLTALKDLMGHRQTATTETYLRRRDRSRGMEVVVDLDWETKDTFEASRDTEKEGFEPSFASYPSTKRPGHQQEGS